MNFNLIKQKISSEIIDTVNGRELQFRLGNETPYTNWIKRAIDAAFLVNGEDYILITQVIDNPEFSNLKSRESDYFFTIEAAKNIAMMQRSEIGKLVRDYFIDLEKRYNKKSDLDSFDSSLFDKKALELLKIYKEVFEITGVLGNKAILGANQVATSETGVNLLEKAGRLHLLSESQEKEFTPTEIGKIIGKSSQAVNLLLQELLLQSKIANQWVLTDLGKTYGVLMDTSKRSGSGAPILQLKWKESVLELLKTHEPSEEEALKTKIKKRREESFNWLRGS